MKRLTAILFAFGLALMARAETRLGDVVMKDVVVLEPVDKTNLLNTVNALTNGAALGATALQPAATNGWVVGSHAGLLTPPATNTLAAAAAHAATEHGVTGEGGFQGGSGAGAEYGGAVGSGAYTTYGGAVGNGAYTDLGGAVGNGARADLGGAVGVNAITYEGGAVGSGTYTTDGGAVGRNAKTSDGFAGGLNAIATTDGTHDGDGIDAIQLGTGGNSEPFTLQVYSNRLLNADGTIPVARFAATLNASNAADRAYADGLAATNVNAHAQVAAGTNTLGHVANIGFSYANQLLYYTAPQNCTGMVFRFYTPAGTATNIYLWRDQP